MRDAQQPGPAEGDAAASQSRALLVAVVFAAVVLGMAAVALLVVFAPPHLKKWSAAAKKSLPAVAGRIRWVALLSTRPRIPPVWCRLMCVQFGTTCLMAEQGLISCASRFAFTTGK